MWRSSFEWLRDLIVCLSNIHVQETSNQVIKSQLPSQCKNLHCNVHNKGSLEKLLFFRFFCFLFFFIFRQLMGQNLCEGFITHFISILGVATINFFLNMHTLLIKYKFNQQLYCPPKFQYVLRVITPLFSLLPCHVTYYSPVSQFHLVFILPKLIIIFVVILYSQVISVFVCFRFSHMFTNFSSLYCFFHVTTSFWI